VLKFLAENKKEIRPLGGLKAIIECLTGDDLETKRYALASLINLSNDGIIIISKLSYRC